MIIRNEKVEDQRIVEEITRLAFWNLHAPGCNEHYLVHKIRTHKDYIPELNFVLIVDNKIVGNIIYTKSTLKNENNEEKEILTFGPLTISPDYQRKGYGKKLLEYSIIKAKEMGYSYIVIFGNPGNYVSSGFKSCYKYNIYVGDEIYPTAMLVRNIGNDTLENTKWKYEESIVYDTNQSEAEEFDKQFTPLEKLENNKQEEFHILSKSRIVK